MPAKYEEILQGKLLKTTSNRSQTYINKAFDDSIDKSLYVETVLKEYYQHADTIASYTNSAAEVKPLQAHVDYMLELNKWKENQKQPKVLAAKPVQNTYHSKPLEKPEHRIMVAQSAASTQLDDTNVQSVGFQGDLNKLSGTDLVFKTKNGLELSRQVKGLGNQYIVIDQQDSTKAKILLQSGQTQHTVEAGDYMIGV